MKLEEGKRLFLDDPLNQGGSSPDSAADSAFAPEPELCPPIDIIAPPPEGRFTPLVFSSPHSGRIYPERFLKTSRLDAQTLRRSEDAFVDDLFGPAALSAGAPLLRALFPRAFLDVNREPFELDPRMFEGKLPTFANTRSARVAGGLGTIARVVGENQEIYGHRLPLLEADHRLQTLYLPYHRALRQLLDQTLRAFGTVVLLDCHSMPSAPFGGVRNVNGTKADVILGDRFGTSCSSLITDVLEDEFSRMGYLVGRNKPYAGGFITEHYGNPTGHRHAIQIEINRAIYMDEKTMSPLAGFADVAKNIKMACASLAYVISDWENQQAAAE